MQFSTKIDVADQLYHAFIRIDLIVWRFIFYLEHHDLISLMMEAMQVLLGAPAHLFRKE